MASPISIRVSLHMEVRESTVPLVRANYSQGNAVLLTNCTTDLQKKAWAWLLYNFLIRTKKGKPGVFESQVSWSPILYRTKLIFT